MKLVRTCIATLLLLMAMLSLALPLPGKNKTHLLKPAEAQGTTLTIYSGRSEELVGPLLEQFEQETGIEIEVIYGNTSELALTILEEGENSPADVFFAQDAGALGLLADANLLDGLPGYILDSVDPRFVSLDGVWVGISGRARVITYNTDHVKPEDLPESLYGMIDPVWRGRVGFAPTNGSFHAHMTAMRVVDGDDKMREFVQGLVDNESATFENNAAAVAAVAAGEIDAALVNHYYLYQHLAEDPDAPIANYFFLAGDIGDLVNAAGVGILKTSDSKPLAQQFISFLLSRTAQTYFAEETYEYPMVIGVEADERLVPLEDIKTPEVDLSDLSDLQGTLEILDEVINQ
jgi:iron(III) transport system substrate-binding protein